MDEHDLVERLRRLSHEQLERLYDGLKQLAGEKPITDPLLIRAIQEHDNIA